MTNAKLLRHYIVCAFVIAVGVVCGIKFSHTPLFRAVILSTCLMAIALTTLPAAKLRSFVERAPQSPSRDEWLWTLGGFVLMTGTLVWLEFRHGYYFAQDDNQSCYLPVWLTAMKSFFATGSLPTWNGYQFLGTPTTSLGIYALTYPLTYTAYAIARFILGNERLALEVFAFLHFIPGYFFSATALKKFGLRPALAATGALCFMLLGFNLVAGRSWFYMISTVAYLPALMWSWSSFEQSKIPMSKRWVLATGITIGLYFHSGSVQMWCYGACFWGLGIASSWYCGDRKWNRLRPVVAAALLGIAISLPLLIVQAIETSAVPRKEWNENMFKGLDNLFLPYPLIRTNLPWGQDRPDNTGFYYSGGVFTFLFFLQCAYALAFLAVGKMKRRDFAPLALCVFAAIALILGLGPEGLLWTFFQKVPPFNKFRVPFRMLPFATFFVIAAGGLMAEKISRRLRRGNAFVLSLVAVAATSSLWSATLNTSAFYNFEANPYPPLADNEKNWTVETFTNRGRVHPLGNWRSAKAGFSSSLKQNFATYYRIPVTGGYDTDSLEQYLPETAAARSLIATDLMRFLREYGVEHVTYYRLNHQGDTISSTEEKSMRKIASVSEERPDLITHTIGDKATTKPMAYCQSEPSEGLQYAIVGNGVDILTPSRTTASVLVANFLHRHWFTAHTTDGKTLRPFADSMGRIAIEIPAGTTGVSIRYAPPWWIGLVAGAFLMTLAGLVPAYLPRLPRRPRSSQ